MLKGRPLFSTVKYSALLLSTLLLTSCATEQNVDPMEGFNRTMFKVDRTIDTYVLHQVVKVYDKVLPSTVHTGIGNFFSNTIEPARIANDLLQLDIKDALNDLGRLMVNTTLGIGGLFDFASKMGMVKHRNDFGITLAKWGYRNSAYLYIPLFGPMTVRDSLSYGVDYFVLNPISYIEPDKVRLSLLGLGQIHYRWRLLPAKSVIDESFDPYIFVRDAYLQNRSSMINQVVREHHAATEANVNDYDEPMITEEDHQEAQQKNEHLSPDTESDEPLDQTQSSSTPTRTQPPIEAMPSKADEAEKTLKPSAKSSIHGQEQAQISEMITTFTPFFEHAAQDSLNQKAKVS